MRRINAGLYVSLDGVVSDPGGWRQPFDSETSETFGSAFVEADTILLGRRTYLAFAHLWTAGAGAGTPMAEYMNSTPKIVASTTLTDLAWGPAELVGPGLAERLRALKAAPGGDIQVPGSPSLVWWLLGAGLLDTLSLMTQPVVVGSGTRLPDLGRRADLVLSGSTALKNGSVCATYLTTDMPRH